MRANSSPMSVADYCHEYNNGNITVNNDYQRKVGLWTSQAKSFFIESILLEFPIPKLYLHARIDLKSRKQFKEVVDGQQRTQALVSFFNNKQRLTNNIDTAELRGLKYDQLPDEWKAKFLSYSLPIDQFVGADDSEIREAFRRMNANNVPLNDEEQRNAKFQGLFKWFIVRIADKYKEPLTAAGLFSRRDIIRMADLKLYAEVCLALDSGLTTVKGPNLDALYKRYNSSFDREAEFDALLSEAIDHVMENPDMMRPQFMKAHIFQSLMLAVIARRHQEVLERLVPESSADELADVSGRGLNLEVLADALRDPENIGDADDFVEACSKKTNVEGPKRTRFIHFYSALE